MCLRGPALQRGQPPSTGPALLRPRPRGVERCELFCDEWQQASHGGELTGAVDAGKVKRDQVTELGNVLTGRAPGRSSSDAMTLFDSTGLATQDVAICLAVLEAHRAGMISAGSARL